MMSMSPLTIGEHSSGGGGFIEYFEGGKSGKGSKGSGTYAYGSGKSSKGDSGTYTTTSHTVDVIDVGHHSGDTTTHGDIDIEYAPAPYGKSGKGSYGGKSGKGSYGGKSSKGGYTPCVDEGDSCFPYGTCCGPLTCQEENDDVFVCKLPFAYTTTTTSYVGHHSGDINIEQVCYPDGNACDPGTDFCCGTCSSTTYECYTPTNPPAPYPVGKSGKGSYGGKSGKGSYGGKASKGGGTYAYTTSHVDVIDVAPHSGDTTTTHGDIDIEYVETSSGGKSGKGSYGGKASKGGGTYAYTATTNHYEIAGGPADVDHSGGHWEGGTDHGGQFEEVVPVATNPNWN
jgi:hypothetical protein